GAQLSQPQEDLQLNSTRASSPPKEEREMTTSERTTIRATADTLRLGQPRSGRGTGEEREAAIEIFARILLRRYGIVFRRLLERESFKVSWYELGRVYRRLEARGEIRGGHFVSGISGEQFALPEAIGLLRSIRKSPTKGELIVISGADPLNLVGVLTPGPRVAAITA